MKRIVYLFCAVFTFIGASARQVCRSSNVRMNISRKDGTLFFADYAAEQGSHNTLFSDTDVLSRPAAAEGHLSFSFFYWYGRQGNYNSRYGNVSYVNHLKLLGADWGGVIDYRIRLYNNIFITPGIGYLNFEIHKIDNETENGNLTVRTHARPINYPSTILVLYQTTRYHYNSLCFHVGLEKRFIAFNKVPLFASIDYLHAYRISGVYYIPFAGRHYRTKNRGNFGDFINARFGMNKQLGRFSLAPAFVLSIYNGWRQDKILGEDPSKVVSNRFNGAGVSMAISYQVFH